MNSPEKPQVSSVIPLHSDSRRGLPLDIPEDGSLTGQVSPFASNFLVQSNDRALYLSVAEAMRCNSVEAIISAMASAGAVAPKDVCIVHFRRTKHEEWRGNMAAYFHHDARNDFYADMKDSVLTGAIPNQWNSVFAAVADTPAFAGAVQVMDAYFKLVVDLGVMRILRAPR